MIQNGSILGVNRQYVCEAAEDLATYGKCRGTGITPDTLVLGVMSLPSIDEP